MVGGRNGICSEGEGAREEADDVEGDREVFAGSDTMGKDFCCEVSFEPMNQILSFFIRVRKAR